MIPTIETNRLLLRPILASDIDEMYIMDSDPEVHRFLGQSPVADKSQLAGVIEHIRQQYTTYGIGRMAVVEKKSQRFIGWAGLKYETQVRDFPYYDIGYRFNRNYWGKGYATEASGAAIQYGFQTLQLPSIHAGVEKGHTASANVLTKLGFTLDGTFFFDQAEHEWYTLLQENAE